MEKERKRLSLVNPLSDVLSSSAFSRTAGRNVTPLSGKIGYSTQKRGGFNQK